ncbi:hypothetical protein [Mycoplana dimorpha]|uniref:WG repeat-containing protein n=1 Tax=Mycoplana dimorpha TaxID=28320 RepID=A0A2T5BF55_MYCDI|nr:hypothetical protein [Mycoplana dimorpha]PTM97605.1 hypothetical protein C7449_102482 [Mycoplana dimorpha]
MRKALIMSNPAPTRLSLLALSTLCLTAGAASSEELDGPKIRKLIAGETVRLNTPFGIALPLRYRTDGVVVGDISGISAASMFAPKEEGRWWVEDNSLCQKWPSWYNGRRFCFKIRRLGERKISWLRDDGASGTALVGD